MIARLIVLLSLVWSLLGLSLVDAADLFKSKRDTKRSESESSYWKEPVARVNGEVITREALADELIATYGEKQLELMINRKIVEQECARRRIDVSKGDVEREFSESLKNLNLSKKEFVERVLAPRGMLLSQHMRDNIWPKVALLKLVENEVTVTDEDIQKAFEANFGPKVDCRMLVVQELRRAHELWEQIHAETDVEKRLKLFEDLCKQYSTDSASRPMGGQIAPINRHSSHRDIEELAFGLKPGELSKIIEVPEGRLMLLCVKHIPESTQHSLDSIVNPETNETVRDFLRRAIRDKKVAFQAKQYFERAFAAAEKQNYLTGDFDIDSTDMPEELPGPKPSLSPSPNAN